MRDLYLQLGIKPDASAEVIEAAIRQHPELTAAAEVLLNPQRRPAYQRTVFTLRSIGTLRHRLALDKDISWFQETCPDFVPRSQNWQAAAAPEPEAVPDAAVTKAPVSAKSVASEPAQASSNWLKPALLVAAIAALLALLYSVL